MAVLLLVSGLIAYVYLSRPTVLEFVDHSLELKDHAGALRSKSTTIVMKVRRKQGQEFDKEDFQLITGGGTTIPARSVLHLDPGQVSLLDLKDEFADQSRAVFYFELPANVNPESGLSVQYQSFPSYRVPRGRKQTNSTMQLDLRGRS